MTERTRRSFNEAMGAVIRRERKHRGLTLKALGDALDVSYQQIQKSEAGQNGFSACQLSKLADLFGVTVGNLFDAAAVKSAPSKPSPADNDGFLAARYVARIRSEKLRRNIIDFARKCAYEEAA
jgi:transcriptional regulator with XRE-family HTH domain